MYEISDNIQLVKDNKGGKFFGVPFYLINQKLELIGFGFSM